MLTGRRGDLLNRYGWGWYSVAVTKLARQISLPHQDPTDRFLLSTALVYDLPLSTVYISEMVWSFFAEQNNCFARQKNKSD